MLTVKNEELKIKKGLLGIVNKYLLYARYYKILKPLEILNKFVFHLEIPKDSLTKRLRMVHPFNIIINSGAQFGENITIYQNVTIGSKQWGRNSGAPIINDNVIVYPNSIIIGKIIIGKNAIIGAGSVVLRDVEEYSIVAGNPAKQVGLIV